jgi:hypothetical protein
MSRERFFGWSHYLVLAVVLVSLLAVLIPISVVRADEVVTFPDPNLEAAIREATGKPTGDIFDSDLSSLSTLRAVNKQISDLTGLEDCTSLSNLYLDENQIGDLSPIASLTNLTELNLGSNQITDISPLSGLTSLTNLSLFSNQIRDLSPLSGLTNLTWLSLFSNQIRDIESLVNNAGMASGDIIQLWGNPLNSISVSTYILALQARGVEVTLDAPADAPAGSSGGMPTWAWALIGLAVVGVVGGAAYFISTRLGQRESSKSARRLTKGRKREHRKKQEKDPARTILREGQTTDAAEFERVTESLAGVRSDREAADLVAKPQHLKEKEGEPVPSPSPEIRPLPATTALASTTPSDVLPVCPNCGAELKVAPKRKKKCVACGNFMYVRSTPSGGPKLLTEQEAIEFDRHRYYKKEIIVDGDDQESSSHSVMNHPQQEVTPSRHTPKQEPRLAKCPFCRRTTFRVVKEAGIRRCSECHSVLPSYIQGNK